MYIHKRVVIDAEDTVKSMQIEVQALMDEVIPLCTADLEKVITAASAAGMVKVMRVRSDMGRLLDEANSRKVALSSLDMARMIIVLANLTSMKAALEVLLGHLVRTTPST
jgi:hypothetical protein